MNACPLCGNDNRCAMATGKAAESCWCYSRPWPATLTVELPEGDDEKACICPECVRRHEAAKAASAVDTAKPRGER